jgi:hypothetical protein
MNKPVYIVDLFQTIVNSTSTALDMQIGYEFGHPYEINETLVSLSKSPVTQAGKFPLVALFTDIKEKKGQKFGTYANASLHIVIAEQTQQNLKSSERMEQVFKPTLQPIYDELINQIARSKYFSESTAELILHDKTDRLYWGKSGIMGNAGLIFTDLLDCIEIENLVLNVKTQNC